MFLACAGLLAVLTGLAMQIWPQSGVWVLTILFGTFTLVTGIVVSISAARLRCSYAAIPYCHGGGRRAEVTAMRTLGP